MAGLMTKATAKLTAKLMAKVMAIGWVLTFCTAVSGGLLLGACSRDEAAATPLPTREKTIGRVEQSLQKADDEAAKRREEIDNATK